MNRQTNLQAEEFRSSLLLYGAIFAFFGAALFFFATQVAINFNRAATFQGRLEPWESFWYQHLNFLIPFIRKSGLLQLSHARNLNTNSLISFFAAYFLLIASLKNYQKHRPLSFFHLCGIAVLASLPLMLSPELFSSDVYDYVSLARLVQVHEANPFFDPVKDFRDDPFVHITSWVPWPTPYGPAGVYANVFIGALLPKPYQHIVAYILIYKFAALFLHISTSWFLWKMPGLRRTAATNTMIYLFNPFLLIEFPGNAHVDAVMIFWIAWGFYLREKGRPWLGFVSVTMAALTKIYSLPLVMLYALAQTNPYESFRDKMKRFGLSALLFLIVCFILYAPYWEGPSTLNALFRHPAISILTSSFIDCFRPIIESAGPLPFLGTLFGNRGIGLVQSYAWTFTIGVFILLAATVRKEGGLSRNAAIYALVWSAVGDTSFYPWHAAFFVTLAVMSRSPLLRNTSLIMSFTLLTYYSMTEHWPPNPGLLRNMYPSRALLFFLPPVLYLFFHGGLLGYWRVRALSQRLGKRAFFKIPL